MITIYELSDGQGCNQGGVTEVTITLTFLQNSSNIVVLITNIFKLYRFDTIRLKLKLYFLYKL